MTNYEIEKQEWWVQRWNDLLNSYRFKKRLERARNYAREGNVLSIDFKGSQVIAKVQGTAAEPYELSIFIDPFTEEDWNYVVKTMADKAIYSAQLLAGEMPENIEQVFTSNGLSLFPFTLSDIHSQCSCPDPKNPCKHIGAVYYQLGDRFSEDPFILFQLRGRTKTEILNDLRRLRSTATVEEASQQTKDIHPEPLNPSEKTAAPSVTSVTTSVTTSATTPINIEEFWQYNEPLDPSLVVITPPPDNQTILDVLGPIPFAGIDDRTMEYFREVYQTVSQQAMMSALNRE